MGAKGKGRASRVKDRGVAGGATDRAAAATDHAMGRVVAATDHATDRAAAATDHVKAGATGNVASVVTAAGAVTRGALNAPSGPRPSRWR